MLFLRFRRHLINLDSQHRQIALGFIWVSIFVLIGKLAGAAKEMAIAWRFGVSATVDAYVFVFNLVNWPLSVWFTILNAVLLPLAARLISQAPEELPRFRSELLGFTLLLGLALGLLVCLCAPFFLRTGFLGLSSLALTQALHMINGMALLVPLGMVISLFSTWLLASGYHRNTLFEAIPALVIFLAMLLPPELLPEPLLWGTVAGFALHAGALAMPLLHHGELGAPTIANRSPAWRFFWASIGVMALGQTLTSLTNLVDQFFAAGLGEGALSTLSYANRILALILALGSTAIARAALPVFSDEISQGGIRIQSMAYFWGKWMLLFGFVVLILGWVMAPLVTSLMFEHGSFTTQDTKAVTKLLRFALPIVLFYFPAAVFVSALAALSRHKWMALCGVFNLICKLPLAFLFVHYFGLSGLMLSTVIMYALSSMLLLFFVSRTTKPVVDRGAPETSVPIK